MTHTNEELAKLKMDKVAIRLVTEQPFFATILMGIKRKPDPGCGSVWCDGVHIGYDPDYVNDKAPGDLRTAPLDTLMGVVVHELYHVSALHHLRIQDMPDPELANRACDFAINPLIKNAGFKLPKDALDDARFNNMPIEQIYKVLVKESKPSGGGGNGQQKGNPGSQQGGGGSSSPQSPNFGQGQCPNAGGCGCVKPMPSPSGKEVMDKNERRQAEEEQIMRNKQAAERAKTEGKLPGDMEREINEQVKPVVDWREVLHRYIDEHMNANDYSYRRPNRRYAGSGFYMPELRSPEIGTICLAMDTSGSISEGMLTHMVSECLDCLESYVEEGQTDPRLPVIYCDHDVQRVEVLTPGCKPHPAGGGGTRFSPVFDVVRKKADEWNIRAVVYMTDGYCSDFGVKPDYPVLWILNGDGFNSNFNPPFGEVAIMKGATEA